MAKANQPTATLDQQPPEKRAELEALLTEWAAAVKAAAAAKPAIEAEQEIRKKVFTAFFPAPVEGTNQYGLTHGWTLKATHKIDRKVDGDAWPAVKEKLLEIGVVADPLVTFEPKLDTKAYKALLTINAAAGKVMDTALTIKPGSPTLELVAPKVPTIDPQGPENA